MILASSSVITAEPVFTTENIGVLTALILALSGFVATILSARTKAKVDEIGKLQALLSEAEEDRDKAKKKHDDAVTYYEARITTLQRQIDDRDHAINKLDRIVLACRAYIAKLGRLIVDRGDELPARPAGMDD